MNKHVWVGTVAAMVMVGCAETQKPTATITPQPTNPPTPTVEASFIDALPPDEILLRVWYSPGAESGSYLVTQVPDFTLYANGAIIYSERPDPDKGRVLTYQLDTVETREFVGRVLALGIGSLHGYEEDRCGVGTDADTLQLRVRLDASRTHDINAYANCTDNPEALDALFTLLDEYRRPQAELYYPEQAVVILYDEHPYQGSTDTPEWPIDPEIPEDSVGSSYAVINGEQAAVLIEAMGTNFGEQIFTYNGDVYWVFLFPLLINEELDTRRIWN